MAGNEFFVKPKHKGSTVLKPNGQRLKAEGELMYSDVEFWHRRIKDGDVELVKNPPKKASQTATSNAGGSK